MFAKKSKKVSDDFKELVKTYYSYNHLTTLLA